MKALFDCYRAGELLAGRLPVVVDGAFDDLGPERGAAIAEQLKSLGDVQVIVVTADTGIANLLAGTGATSVAWPAASATFSAVPGGPKR